MNRRELLRLVGGAPLALYGARAGAADVRSGPQPGDRTLPFTSTMVTGPQRGKQYCYVCELKDEPAVLVFARRPDDATGRLLRDLAEAIQEHQKEKLFAWMVFLAEPDTAAQTGMERRAYDLARANSATGVPISVLGDPQGPPGYLIAPDAEVTVLFFRSGKVVANRAFRAREWSARAASSALKELPKLLATPPEPRS
jgi:hypothetical protein